MQAFRQLRHLTRFVLVWFALSLGVTMASSLVAPKATELVCTSGGMVKLVAVDGTDSAAPSHAQMDCALCMLLLCRLRLACCHSFNHLLLLMPCNRLQRRISHRPPRRHCLRGPPAPL
jgi:hypothetical protein